MSLHTKYRPVYFDQVMGQSKVVQSVEEALRNKSGRAFLFTGPAGVGKTTIGRIIAAEVKCAPRNLVEVDAATNSGIDAMRAITESLQFAGLGSPVKMIIIDEAHALSAAAWQSLLKVLEEPPAHVYWALCTTNLAKVPKTIQTRCLMYTLAPIHADKIFDVLKGVVEQEKFTTPDVVLDLIARKAEGSMRRALTNLAQCANCKTAKEAGELLQQPAEDGEVIDLCRELAGGKLKWGGACDLVKSFAEKTNPESVRIVVFEYFSKVAMGSTADRAGHALAILNAFKDPYPSQAGMGCVLLSLGQLLLAE